MEIEQDVEARRGVSRARRVQAGALVGAAAVLGAPVTTFAAPPTIDATAGEAVTDLADRGAAFVGTYGVPALIVSLGVGVVWKLLKRIGRGVTM